MRFTSNVLAFYLKCPCVLVQTQRRFFMSVFLLVQEVKCTENSCQFED